MACCKAKIDPAMARVAMTPRITKIGRENSHIEMSQRMFLEEIEAIREDRKIRYVIDNGRQNKRRKVFETVMAEKGGDDLISRLPEDVLCSIISRLSMREAMRTSVLSRAWKDLWKRSFETLNFEADVGIQGLRTNKAFVKQVNRILALHCGTKVDSFRVKCDLSWEFHKDIDGWIQFAAEKKIQKIDLSMNYRSNEFKDCFSFPFCLFTDKGNEASALKHLTLSYCSLNIPQPLGSFSSLISLSIENARVTTEFVLNMFSICSSLQWLSMRQCYFSERKFIVSESCPPLKLKHFSMLGPYDLDELDIRNAKNLISFEYQGFKLERRSASPVLKILLYHIHDWDYFEFAELDIDDIASDFPQLEFLSFSLPHLEVPLDLPTFTNLKYLVLKLVPFYRVDLWELVSAFLKASPLLRKLELLCPQCRRDREIEEISACHFQHNNLKEVTMSNFQVARDVELLMYLVNCAPAIEKIEIETNIIDCNGDGKRTKRVRLFNLPKRELFLMLRKILPQTIKLEVL